MSKTEPLRVALIGYGAWGKFHAGAIAKHPACQLTAICARSAESQAAARVDFPTATIYADYRELLQRETLDAVDLVLPSHLHHEVGLAVLDSGRHLLIEKPMALSIDDCTALVNRAQEMKLQLAVGHELRVSSLWGRVRQLIDEGRLGDVRYVLVELSRRPYRLGADGWRYDRQRVGSWILEEPIHFFDLARWYLSGSGEPTRVTARGNSRDPARPDLHDNFTAIVDYADGAYAAITQTLAAFEHHQTVKVTGTRGAAWAWWSGALDRTLHPTFGLKWFDGETVHVESFDKPTGEVFELDDQLTALVESIRIGTPSAATGDDGRWSVAMCLWAEQSIRSGSSVACETPQ
jgi:myo-inositol 2-dehydrogenase/D-chiro-inositol 1-dehydrogenase